MQDNAMAFLDVNSNMAKLIREFDWSATSMGASVKWPQSLKTTIGNMLRSKFPTFICWGPELICFYNDGYRQSLGEGGKHPAILGIPFKDAWSEMWHFIHPLLNEVLSSGNAVWKEDQPVSIFRNGELDDTYWTFCYSPLIDESGINSGVLVTCIETTDKIKAFIELEQSHLQLSFAIEAAELGTFDYNLGTNNFTANTRLKQWFGLPDNAELALPLALASIIDEERDKVETAIRASFDPETNGKYEIEYSLKPIGQEEERRVLAKGRVLFNNEKEAIRLSGTLQDISALKKAQIRQQEHKIREQQKMSREKYKAREAERDRLASELHDNICQILAAVKIQLEFFSKKQIQETSTIKDCIKHIDEALRETRDMSHRLAMPRFTETSLAAALINLGNIYNMGDRIVTVTHNENIAYAIPVKHKEALYRIAQEQLNNMQKYSRATQVKISLDVNKEIVSLGIEDNGIGFDPQALHPGIGLANIRNRAESLEGIAKITSTQGGGCSLLIQLPTVNADNY